ncbi:MAG TPA: TonB-dependent receptor [Pyrinomonadaceae bacterium]|nr:TonB-dependent receptor [Pyrinomonadaceae bacterium]
MNCTRFPLPRIFNAFLIVLVASVLVAAQQTRGTLRGAITDELGAVIVGVNVTLTDASGAQKKTTTNAEGVYSFAGLAPGKYSLQANATGFAPSEEKQIDVTAGRQSADLTLKVTIEEKVTIQETPVSTEATNNANQTVIGGKDLDALPDDPNELAAALQALAGPSVGPNGGQIFIDGFTGGNIPSKDSIREIRINQNPFAAENDQPSARIDILTRPGTDKFRGGASLNFTDESLNSRNPFAISSSKRAPFQIRQYDMNFSGPLVARKASFFVNFGRIETDDNELIRATILDDDLNRLEVGQAFVTPKRNTFFSPRFDYAINNNHTLIARYNFNRFSYENQGVGGFSLPERAYDTVSTNHTIQLTETAILNPTTINETRFQYSLGRNEQVGDNSVPALNVSGSFNAGSSQIGNSFNERRAWELNNFTAKQMGAHAIKFGGRVRHLNVDDSNEGNFGGTWTFTGGFGLSSLQRYQLTRQLQEERLTPAQIRAAGGGAASFSIISGNPFATVDQTDLGVFLQDDWRIRPNITVSYGLRYEIQTNTDSKYDFAPRVAVAWSPGAANSARPPKMVIRVGTGFFYNRFSEGSTLSVNRNNGVNLKQTFITEEARRLLPPTIDEQQAANVAAAYAILNQWSPTAVPDVSAIAPTQQIVWAKDPNIQNPTVWVAGTQVERQLPRNITMFLGFYNIRIVHVIRARDVNAPLPATITPLTPLGLRPDPTQGEIYRFEASGQFNQRQFFLGFNTRLSRMFQLNANYSLSKTTNDTDGQGGQLFPMNSYDTSGEFGRSSFDVRHRFTIFGTVNLPWWKVVVNPFVVANSGPPFNIITGQDLNLDRQTTERPSLLGADANCALSTVRCTPFGNFNLVPLTGERIIPRNFGQSPGAVVINLRVGRTFAFGNVNRGNAAAARPAGGGPGGPTAVAAGPGGPRMAAVGPGGPQGPGGAASEKRFNLNVSLYFTNILNHVNLSQPVGNLSSPNFGQSLGLSSTQVNFGGPAGGSSGAGNRRIYAQLRLNF